MAPIWLLYLQALCPGSRQDEEKGEKEKRRMPVGSVPGNPGLSPGGFFSGK